MLSYKKESYWHHLRRGLWRMLPILAMLVCLFALLQCVCFTCARELFSSAAQERRH
jgi:hypothetical protein